MPSLDLNPYLAGEVIGDRYRLVRELGRGGMGVVWVAHSLVLGVDVALKLIRASAAGPAVASRMAREAHAAARLGHPALVRVFDFGWTSRGDPFLVMELVQGETLSAVLSRETRIPAIRAAQMLLPVADGLRLAHDKDIVHRDIKPDNIFLASDAFGRLQPKLLDFGIAKIDHAATPENKLTQVGVVLGSPEYMSPEQALGVDEVDERSDVWSLSVVLYEMVTGTVPFKKPNYNALMQAIIHDPPTPMQDCGAGDSALWLVVERGLAKKREQRWTNMTELGEALALWLYEHGIKEDLSGNSIRAVWLDGALSGVRADLPQSGPPGPSSNPPGAVPSAAATVELPAAGVSSARSRQRRSMALTLVFGTAVGGIAVAALLGARPDLQALLRSAMPPSPTAPASAPNPSASRAPASATLLAVPTVAAPSAAPGPPAKHATASATSVAITTVPAMSAAPNPSAASPSTAGATAVAISALPLEDAPHSTPKSTPKKAAAPPNPVPQTPKPNHDFGF
jgi:serine/threonine-protein kinase